MPTARAVVVLAPIACAFIGAALSLGPRHGRVLCYSVVAVGATLAAGIGIAVLWGVSLPVVVVENILPGNAIAIDLTPLAAAFWVVIGVPTAAVCIFAIGYARHYAERFSLGLLGAVFSLFVASLLLVPAADNALGFVVVWEIMAVLSYLLVVYEHHNRAVVRIGLLYTIMTHAGTACIIACFLILASAAPGGGLDYAALRVAGAHLDPGRAAAVFLLALLGFGTKAGVMPLHAWLPRAHPVAPSHVSALMSGVMIKMGIFGLVLIWFQFLPAEPVWCGVLVIALGAVSALLGVLYALMQHDLKRLLAYHSVENIGIILLGLGAALLLRSSGQQTLAAVALAAALFHTLNHAVFKSLLFMGAGAVQSATHTREMERLGGLIHTMPWTAGFFLAGAAAIAALPPLNGFASEWLVFQSLISVGRHVPSVGATALLAAVSLALTGALAAACFVKAVGIPFLGMSRGDGAAREAGRPELTGMAVLAALCLALGVLPSIVMRGLTPVTRLLLDAEPPFGPAPWSALAAPGTSARTALQPAAVLLAVLGAGLLALMVGRVAVRSRAARVSPVWSCGVELTPRMQYSATSFAQPIRRMFSALVWPDRTVMIDYAHAPYFVRAIRYEVSLRPIFDRFLYAPVRHWFLGAVRVVRWVQNGSVHAYVGYVFAALVAVLVAVR